MTRETCATCRFFAEAACGIYMECRKSPPALYGDRSFSAARFPPTQPAYWCGEHQPVAPAPAASDDYTRAAVRFAEAWVQPDASMEGCGAARAAFLRLYRERHGG